MDEQVDSSIKYQKKYSVLDVMGKIILNIISSGLLLGFGFWLILASNMGPTYLPNVMDGALDIWIRFTLIGIATIIWLVTPIWFMWSSVRYSYNSYKSYQSYKRFK